MEYLIYEDFFPNLDRKILSIGKKCAQNGNPFSYCVLGDEFQERKNSAGKSAVYRFIRVDVSGIATVGEYTAVAMLEMHNTGNLIRLIDRSVTLPEKFRTSENVCEHCHSSRERKNLFVVRNNQTGEFKQVGKSCLKLYTGGLNAETVAYALDLVTELENAGKAEGICLASRKWASLDSVLAAANLFVGKMGYQKSEDTMLPTSALVRRVALSEDLARAKDDVNDTLYRYGLKFRIESSDLENLTSPEDLETVEKIKKYWISETEKPENNSEFYNNVHILLSENFVESKNFGILSYLPEGYRRFLESEKRKAERAQLPEVQHYGEVGKRYRKIPAKRITLVTSYETLYGYTDVFRIILQDGGEITWKTSTWVDEQIRKSENFMVDFTVKAHGEFRGVKQTEVTRVKITV